jgi:hypothetical protein
MSRTRVCACIVMHCIVLYMYAEYEVTVPLPALADCEILRALLTSERLYPGI